jgi:hypothetical protein
MRNGRACLVALDFDFVLDVVAAVRLSTYQTYATSGAFAIPAVPNTRR